MIPPRSISTWKTLVNSLAWLCLLIISWNVLPVDHNEESLDGAISGEYDYLVYAVTWQPTFYILHPEQQGDPHKPADFRVHGIWPYYHSVGEKHNRHPSYCTRSPGCSGEKACALDPSLLPAALDDRAFRDLVPPNAEKMLAHEWEKHGTCYGKDQATYFNDFSRLHRVVRYDKRFTDAIGKRVPLALLKRWFPKSTAFRCLRKGSQQSLFEVFYLIQRDATPYIEDPKLQIGQVCSAASIMIPE